MVRGTTSHQGLSVPRKTELPIMTVREFRARFSRLDHPVRVIRSRRSSGGEVEILGTWTPERRTASVVGSTAVRYAGDARGRIQPHTDGPERSGSSEGR